MKISILVDNTPGLTTKAEFGLSYFIEHSNHTILFDAAQTDLFLANAKIMGLDVTYTDYIVLSHGHFDHGDGLENLDGGTLVCHPGCFAKRYGKNSNRYIGLKLSRDDMANRFNLIETDKPFNLFDGAYFLGEIPRLSKFESQTTPFAFDDETPDFVMDDSALAFTTEKGLFVVTGCGHAGIINTLEYAKAVTGIDKIFGIIGGFHLKENNRQTKETIAYLKANSVERIYPSHCTALPALAAFHKEFSISQIKTGEVINL